ncbi:ABC transporter ATP-binding protein [Iamia sp. SCSIO 61187]|nr:ABC transporter ATP-binding protein [Iamia sp. SCSIO 61187]
MELTGITKRFPGVIANRDVNLRVDAGTIHAVVGENGAGKSTLMKILYGMQRPDEGTIAVDGSLVSFRRPTHAIKAGIGMVHQHFMLADNLTVLENIVLGAEPDLPVFLSRNRARRRIEELERQYGLAVDPDALVEDLGVGQRQRVEILKVLYRGARVLILDEPTAVLVPQEVEDLFGSLRELKSEGLTVIFISHKLDEVLSVADAITVIRAGTTVATVEPSSVTARDLANLMVGHELPTPETRDSTVTDTVELSLRGVTVAGAGGRPALDRIDLDIRRGEIVGVAGVEGNGQTELINAVMGLADLAAGSIHVGSDDISSWSTRRRREAGVACVPEDRHRDGLLLDAPLWENAALGQQTQAPFASGGFMDRAGARGRAREIIETYDVMTPGVDVRAGALSGGNQQKFVMGRELTSEPQVLVAAHPTRGVDVGAQAAIWEELRKARARGLAVLLISADLDELIGLSDTLVVLYGGRMVARLDPSSTTLDDLGCYMTGTDPAGGGELDVDAAAAEVQSAHPLETVAPTGATTSGPDLTKGSTPAAAPPAGPDLTKGSPT